MYIYLLTFCSSESVFVFSSFHSLKTQKVEFMFLKKCDSSQRNPLTRRINFSAYLHVCLSLVPPPSSSVFFSVDTLRVSSSTSAVLLTIFQSLVLLTGPSASFLLRWFLPHTSSGRVLLFSLSWTLSPGWSVYMDAHTLTCTLMANSQPSTRTTHVCTRTCFHIELSLYIVSNI